MVYLYLLCTCTYEYRYSYCIYQVQYWVVHYTTYRYVQVSVVYSNCILSLSLQSTSLIIFFWDTQYSYSTSTLQVLYEYRYVRVPHDLVLSTVSVYRIFTSAVPVLYLYCTAYEYRGRAPYL